MTRRSFFSTVPVLLAPLAVGSTPSLDGWGGGAERALDPVRFASTFDAGTVRLEGDATVREFVLRIEDVNLRIGAPTTFPAWTFNGSVPGPTLRCRVGDRLRITLINDSISEHTLHFHGTHPAVMDGVAPIVPPGGRFVYEFDAEPFGLHLYHCHVPPVHLHMARGLFGLLLIDPPTSRPPARELVLVMHGWDTDFDRRNDVYAFNGVPDVYHHAPLTIHAGEPVRLYLASALEYDAVSTFHLHGTVFDVYQAGTSLSPHWTSDVIALTLAERCILEFEYRWPGTYMFHPHQAAMAEHGAMGAFRVIP